MHNILIITYSYCPDLSPRAFRWTAIAEHWAKQGHSVDVLCLKSSGVERFQIHNGVNIYRVSDPMAILKRTKNASGADSKLISDSSTFKTFYFKTYQLLAKIHNVTWKKLYWPDYACLWIFPVYLRAKKLLRVKNYSAIVTVSNPFSDHVIGFLLANMFKKAKWIVDIGDPFSFWGTVQPNNFRLYKKINYIAEKKVLSRADSISVTTDKTKERYIKYFTKISNKIHTIPPLLSISLEETKNTKIIANKDNKIKMLFVGTLYKKSRSPDFLLETFKHLLEREQTQDIELHFAGKINNFEKTFNCYKRASGNKIIYHGLVERKEVCSLINSAQILINIDNSTSFQLPSKVVEYMATGKPILNITFGKAKFTDHLAIDYPNVCNVDSSRDIDEATLNEIQQFIFKKKTLSKNELAKILSPYKIEAISKQYLKLL